MRLRYSDQIHEDFNGHSIFLVGPTPRDETVKSWRPAAIQILKDHGYNGTVLIPEWSTRENKTDYIDQVEWEFAGLQNCTTIAAWVDRSFPDMPAFTTNVEFGLWVRDPKFIYGRPDHAPKNAYLDWLYGKLWDIEPHNSLEELLIDAMD